MWSGRGPGFVHHREPLFILRRQSADELLRVGDVVPVQETLDTGILAGIVGRIPVRLGSVKTGQVFKQVIGQRTELVIAQSQFLKEEKLIENVLRDRFQAIAIQFEGFQKEKLVEYTIWQFFEVVEGKVQAAESVQAQQNRAHGCLTCFYHSGLT